jgi:predicted ABC-type sugar transport system permease subunit
MIVSLHQSHALHTLEVHMSLAAQTAKQEFNFLKTLSSLWSWIFLGILIVFFEVWARAIGTTFLFNLTSVQSILLAAVQPLLIALGMTLVIIAGGIDLSVGFTVGLAAVTGSLVMQALDPSLPALLSLLISIVVALLTAAVVGVVNGILIARLKVPAFIGTLGMYGVARGVAFLISSGTPVPVENKLNTFLGNENALWIVPIPVLITVIIAFVMHYVLSRTKFGQYTYAIGGNKNAALRAGVNVDQHTILLYVLTALLAGVAGVIYTGRFTAGAAQAGEPTLLNAIAAVVIGGASLFGGEGTITGTVIGALIIAVIEFGLVFINVAPFWQFIAVGAVIILSVLVDQARRSVEKS